ncbi:MAG: TIGR04283 family arsenosugar biosynthesis glycosyltransferase [Bdellovibrionota bacterium]
MLNSAGTMPIALAVFAKTPGLSPVKTRLAAEIGAEQADEFYRLSLECVQSVVLTSAAKLQFAPFWALADSGSAPTGFQEVRQLGDSLGERLSSVYDFLRRSFSGIVFIGADSPQLSEDDLRQAVESLRADPGDGWFGPADDGGFYLFACGNEISREIWASVTYSNADTLAQLASKLCESMPVRYLEPSFDVDTKKDLAKLRSHWTLKPPLTPAQRRLSEWLAQNEASSTDAAPLVSIVIPTLQEERSIGETLSALRKIPEPIEVIIVDGGSTDRTVQIATRFGARICKGPPGRGTQLGAGAATAKADVLFFLHADTHPRPDAVQAMLDALKNPRTVGGTFRIAFRGGSSASTFLTWLYPRLRFLGLSYGDAGIFVRKSAYEKAGGFQSHPIFEDLDLINRLKRVGSFTRLKAVVETSSRRFEGRSFTLTFAWWTVLQILYWMGVPPARLGNMYRHIREREKA